MRLQRIHLIPALAGALALVAGTCNADAASDAKKAIATAYNSQSASIVKGDGNAYAATHTADFHEVDKAGKKKQTIAQIKQILPMLSSFMKNVKHKVTVQSIKLKGKTATVAATETMEGSMMNPQTNKSSTMHARRTVSDTWVNQGGKWLRKVSKTLSEKQTVDGKAM